MTFPVSGGVVMLTSAADAAGDVFRDALRIENAASPRVRATLSAGVAYNNALNFDATGRLFYVDATAGLPGGTVWANGFPLSGGALCISTNAASTWANGVPYAANGAVSAGVTP